MSLAGHELEIKEMYFNEGKPMQEIGDHFGVSREAVRQYLNRHFPGEVGGREFRKQIMAAEREANDAEDLEQRMAEALPCVVCYEPVTRRTGGRGDNRTCQPAHSKLWSSARFLLDPELRKRQRLSIANSILRHKHAHEPSAITWAKKVRDGKPIDSRTYVRSNSGAREAYEEVMRIRSKKCSLCGTHTTEKRAARHHAAHMKGTI